MINQSGIVMSVVTKRFSSGKEPSEISSDVMYYGKLVDIIELDYYDEPFILATDARMVYYIDDPVDQVLFLANCACNWFNMKRANSGQVMLEKLQGQKGKNSSESTQNMQQQTSDNQEGVEPAHVNTNDASYGDDNFETSSNSNETQSKDREEPLFVKVKDTSSGEIETRKMQAIQVWHLEKTKKVIVELNGYGQGNDNGSNLLVRFLGLDCADWTAFVHHYKEDKMKKQSLANTRSRKNLKVSHAGGSMSNARRGRQMELKLQRPVCRGEVVLSTLLKKDGSYVSEEGKTLADKISEHLPQDQENVTTSGVSSKVFAHPNDAIGKAYGAEHSGRVHGLGTGICPSSAFAHTQNRLATLEKFLVKNFGSELTIFARVNHFRS
ncbi:PREDICTED: uncharacterized protein LOC109344745 [Lupinus angustifolius]|uniref:uncharacterized protein LOC109344745 n=1 Tax=Lupinus angustifolius TaxID=3871 RepID=UPI00092FCF4A|nr:PREDICTED: uncharacterized protein LOC109344745 [Lupinus angustifolius]